MARPGRFPKRERKLNGLRVYLEYYPEFSDESGDLYHERFAPQVAGLRRVYLYVSSLEKRFGKERSYGARRLRGTWRPPIAKVSS